MNAAAKRAFLFPGQGSQRIGMGNTLFDAYPELTNTADAILGYSIKELCLQDPRRELSQTQFTQPALYVVNALTFRHHIAETGQQPNSAAGHSLGEYNALECAGAISFEDGLRLVCKRGALMAAAPKGAMAAIIGMDAEKVGTTLREDGLDAIDVANFNARNQTVISGLQADVSAAQASFDKHGAMFIPLNVSSAFHSRYMRPAREAFAAFLREFSFSAPRIPVIANIDAQPYPADGIADKLEQQLVGSVRWFESIEYLLRQGVSEFQELGPGDVLTKMLKGIRSQFKDAPPDVAPATPIVTPAAVPKPADPHERVATWNTQHPVGSRVKVAGYDAALTTRTEAMVLFGHRAAIYMQGYNGYFALDDVQPLARS